MTEWGLRNRTSVGRGESNQRRCRCRVGTLARSATPDGTRRYRPSWRSGKRRIARRARTEDRHGARSTHSTWTRRRSGTTSEDTTRRITTEDSGSLPRASGGSTIQPRAVDAVLLVRADGGRLEQPAANDAGTDPRAGTRGGMEVDV